MPPKPSKTLKVKNLEVPDSPTIEAFMKEARKVWRQHHSGNSKRRGRPPEIERVFAVLLSLFKEGKIASSTTQGKLIGIIKQEIGDQKLGPDAIRKYAKMFRLIVIKAQPLTSAENQWLHKHFKAHKDIKNFRDTVNYHELRKNLIKKRDLNFVELGPGIQVQVTEYHLPQESELQIGEAFQKAKKEIYYFLTQANIPKSDFPADEELLKAFLKDPVSLPIKDH